MKVLILNGPNLNLLGTREPDVYGYETLDEVIGKLKENFPSLSLHHFQSNHEGALIDKLHEVGFSFDGIVFNPGAYAHTSIALRDAVAGITTPVIEVHISNVKKREDFRQHSYLSTVVAYEISGKGVDGYKMAIDFLLSQST